MSNDPSTVAVVALLSDPNLAASTPTNKVFTLCQVTFVVAAGATLGDELSVGLTVTSMSATNGDVFRPQGKSLPTPATVADRFQIAASAGRVVVGAKMLRAAVPFAAQYRLVNMALITGTKVSVGLDVLGVFSDGSSQSLAFASCASNDSSVLQVDASCKSVFVDGSETGVGSAVIVNVTVNGLATSLPFAVYAPALPVKLLVNDDVLQRVSGWKDPAANCQTMFQFTQVEIEAVFSFGTIRLPSTSALLKTQLISSVPDTVKVVCV